MKTCKQCKKDLPKNKEYFHINSRRKDGFRSKCKVCSLNKNLKEFSIQDWYLSRTVKFRDTWKYNDILWLYENYLNLEKQEILDYFNQNISYKTLTNIVYQWGLRKVQKNSDWSENELILLKENYPNSPQEILEQLFPNRTWQSIKTKASKLNIARSNEMLLKINSDCHKGIIPSSEARQKMSLSRRGNNNHNWKGGISPIVVRLRDYTIPWKLDSLKAYDFKCALSEINDGTLEVHHQNDNFSDLVYETFEMLDLKIEKDMSKYTDEERDSIRDTLLSLHYKCGLGIPLTRALHIRFHAIYGNKNNNFNQFTEFKKQYESGNILGGVKVG